MDQLERIRQMEDRFDRATAALSELERALDSWQKIQKNLSGLESYYSGGLWMQDFEDDSAGKLPPELKRGVLSEDAVWNLLENRRELGERMKALAEEMK